MTRTLALKFQIRVPSFDVQAELLKKALAPFYDQIVIPATSLYGQNFTTWFVFTPSCASYLLELGMCGSMIHAQRVMYITSEGIPKTSKAQSRILNDPVTPWTVLAVSEFSKETLLKVNIHVDGVVPHAIDQDEPCRVKTEAEKLRAHYDGMFKDRVLFSYTGSTVARKRVDLMIPAFREAYEKSGHKIALISNSHLSAVSAPQVKSPNPQPIKPDDTWCLEEKIFGKSPHEYVAALQMACDFGFWPTVCEGFGVPPLETMNCGKPIVAGKFRPSTEFMNEYTTVWYPCENVKYESYGMEQDFEMHYYNHSDLVDAILKAVDIKLNSIDTYNSMCSAARKRAIEYDYRKVYGVELRKYLK
jgi:glycosyltransferase involved in cell wall biosynthesis